MRVPLLDLGAQYAAIREEIRSAIDRVCDAQRFVLGPEVEALENEIAAYCRCAHAIGVSSGTDALLASLMAIDLKPGDEVITTPYSFFATAAVVARLGATPVFVDIDRRTYNLHPAKIEARISPKTRAVIAVHLFGQMADMPAMIDIARRHKLTVIEDAAHAIGAELRGQRAGSVGHLACFSFYPSKNLGAFGDAGMITTNDANLAERLRLLRSHGFKTKYQSQILGGNFRLDEIQAAVLRVKLKYLDGWTEARRRNAGLYRERLQGNTSVQLPCEARDSRHVYNQFVIRTKQRDDVITRLRQQEIGFEIYYPIPLHLQPCFRNLEYREGDCPVSEEAAKESLALPIYPELTPEMIGSVCAVLGN